MIKVLVLYGIMKKYRLVLQNWTAVRNLAPTNQNKFVSPLYSTKK